MRHNDQRGVVGHGPEAFAAVGEALLRFDVHRGAFPKVTVSAARAAVGVTVEGHVGPFSTPCRITAVREEEHARGFTYATLRGNPVRGEEEFLVTLLEDGRVGFRLASWSEPVGLFALVAPLTRTAQDIANRRYFASARRAASTTTVTFREPRFP